jgi:5-methylcytosine-specific restriction endonuclease McrA
MNKQSILLPCDNCRKLVNVKKWQIQGKYKRKHHFCSLNCRYKWQKGLVGKKNNFFGKHHSKEAKLILSKKLKGRVSNRKGVILSLETREKMSESKLNFFRLHPEAREKLGKLQLGRKQSQETILKRVLKNKGKKRNHGQIVEMRKRVLKGSNCHFWRGGVSKINRTERQNIARSNEYRDWRKLIFERDDYTCRKCEKKGKLLRAHHILNFSKYPKLRYKINNGITLCEKCHKEFHKKYKNTSNTRKQINEFLAH